MTTTVDVSGPVEGHHANRMPADLAATYGYREEEYHLSGEALAYRPVGDLTPDGRWEVAPLAPTPYTSRVVVRRPDDPRRWNGTVLVEWFNVSAGVDGDPDFGLLHPVILGEGYAYVGVTAQRIGVGDGDDEARIEIADAPPDFLRPLKHRDPDRYGGLSHPGDEYSYDIFSDVAAAIRSGDLLDGRAPDHVIAIGESQSAYRLVTFINGLQPRTHAYDGFLVHSRGASPAPFDESETDPDGEVVAIRDDLDVPVLQVLTETDLVLLGFLRARQPDTERLVTWEIAGAAHADASLLEYGTREQGDLGFDLSEICPDINAGPQAPVLRAALAALATWVVDGTRPPTAPPIETEGGRLRRDEHGNVLGGVRTPAVEAPIAMHSGETDADSRLCLLFGKTLPFTAEELKALYPTHASYVEAVTTTAAAAHQAGFLLGADRDAIVAEAEAAPVPG